MSKKLIYLTPNEVTSLSTSEMLFEIREHLRKLTKELWEEEFHYKISEKIGRLAKKNSITWTDISSCWEHPETKKNSRNTRIIKTHYSYAFLYYKKAEIQSHKRDETMVIKLVAHAAYHLGALDNQIKSVKESAKNITRAKLGGLTKSKIRKIVRSQLADFLESPPPRGWRNILETTKAITPKLEEFIISNNYGKVISSTEEFIINEIDKPGELYETFTRNKCQQ